MCSSARTWGKHWNRTIYNDDNEVTSCQFLLYLICAMLVFCVCSQISLSSRRVASVSIRMLASMTFIVPSLFLHVCLFWTMPETKMPNNWKKARRAVILVQFFVVVFISFRICWSFSIIQTKSRLCESPVVVVTSWMQMRRANKTKEKMWRKIDRTISSCAAFLD